MFGYVILIIVNFGTKIRDQSVNQNEREMRVKKKT